ncbi:plexin domain-containing protein 2 isoform X1 [Drosophila pseudoobscura]|uniref:Plexin domain-containing protein 2 isoform X1 n=1 Tax=Drosophila pseudoobscura pseudoobscura TaxID=46245 RepID=A0A6I8VH81_DROPS|nr:plexin domain-containing protein 2 isoform X1 [Drosophila pseudoobscura]
MAKSFGSACAQIAILLAIFGAIEITSARSNPDAYYPLDMKLTFINAHDVVRLPEAEDQAGSRQKRAAPDAAAADSAAAPAGITPDAKSQYQSVNGNASAVAGGTETTVTTVDSKTGAGAVGGSVSYNVHNLGVNGTGQRKDYSVQNADGSANPTATTTINVAAKKPTQLLGNQSQYPKKVAASAPIVPLQMPLPAGVATSTDRMNVDQWTDVDVSDVDVAEEVINKGISSESLNRTEDHHEYYNSTLYINKAEAAALWSQLRTVPENSMLSSSHRRAMTVELQFDFPFYGHYVRNITVATGGFLYTGEYVHSWLAATQYIAPLMANFDTSISPESVVRLHDNGTAFTAVWENVTLQDKPEYGNFTFSVTLHQSGDIVFGYFQVPTQINTIQDNQHPVKVGLSDAYIIDKQLYFARRKTIYEYHRVTFQQKEITNATVIKLTALPTCLGYNDCQACINHNTTFACSWCPALNRCSTGTDRKKHEWIQKGCDTAAIHDAGTCPVLGTKGNNAGQENTGAASSSGSGNSSTASPASSAATEPTLSSTRAPRATAQTKTVADASSSRSPADGKLLNADELSQAQGDNKSVGMAFGFMVPICMVFAVTLWLFYAYRNPHTKSGQLLIQSKHLHQFRPSQWSWRRGEARYTAATIHM